MWFRFLARTNGQTDRQTNEGVLRGPRGPKNRCPTKSHCSDHWSPIKSQFISVIFQPVNYKKFLILIFEYSSNHTATTNHWQCLVAINGDGKAYYELLPLQQLNQNWLKRGQRGPEAQRPDITRYLFDQRKWKNKRPRGPEARDTQKAQNTQKPHWRDVITTRT